MATIISTAVAAHPWFLGLTFSYPQESFEDSLVQSLGISECIHLGEQEGVYSDWTHPNRLAARGPPSCGVPRPHRQHLSRGISHPSSSRETVGDSGRGQFSSLT